MVVRLDHREHLRDQGDGAKRPGGSSIDGGGRNSEYGEHLRRPEFAGFGHEPRDSAEMKREARALPGVPRSTTEPLARHEVDEGVGYELAGGSRGTAMAAANTAQIRASQRGGRKWSSPRGRKEVRRELRRAGSRQIGAAESVAAEEEEEECGAVEVSRSRSSGVDDVVVHGGASGHNSGAEGARWARDL